MNQEGQTVFGSLKGGTERTIISKFLLDGGYTCRAAFCQIQFLQKVSKTAIPITTALQDVTFLNGRHRNTSVRPRTVQYGYSFRLNGNLHGFVLGIISVIKRVDHSFLQRIVRIVPVAVGFLLARNLLHCFIENIGAEKVHCLLDNLRYAALECLFCKVLWILHLPIREHHNLYLGIREELLRMLAEHHRRHILNHAVLATFLIMRFSVGPVNSSICSKVSTKGCVNSEASSLLPIVAR